MGILTATSTKLVKVLKRHPNTLTTLMKLVVAMDGQKLTRRRTAWLRNACSNTVFTRETSTTMIVKLLLKNGKMQLKPRKLNAKKRNLVLVSKLLLRLTSEVTQKTNS